MYGQKVRRLGDLKERWAELPKRRERESFGGVSKVSSNEGAKTAETEKSRGYGVVFRLCVVG